MAPNGTQTLIQMRLDLFSFIKENPDFKAIDTDLKHLMIDWFNRGFLILEQISWSTQAHILEKLIAYEAVHAMDGWDDLRRRLANDRRCFAFFHPALEDEPLIFVEVALTEGIATSVQTLLAEPDSDQPTSEKADTAIFYSISNCQEGLRGISFGNFLIKQVVLELQHELPQLKNFATLSPMPGFMKWLQKERKSDSEWLTTEDKLTLTLLDTQAWHEQANESESLKALLMKLGTHYLSNEKNGSLPLDPVARFHLGNGASIGQLNWLGDTSEKGVKQSAGLLVNYLYRLDKVEENHEAFVNSGEVFMASEVKKLLN
jgi:malonyl-CoA decarboxylase